MWRAMQERQPWRFFEVLQRCGALARLLPEVDRTLERGSSHDAPKDETMEGLHRAVARSEDPVVRLAAALYPAAARIDPVAGWLQRLRAGREEAQLLQDLLALDGRLPAVHDTPALLRLAARLKPHQQPLRYDRFLLAASALWPQTMAELEKPLQMAAETLQRKPPAEFYGPELSGAALGQALMAWRVKLLQDLLRTESEKAGEDGS
jgi:tRNA nucleotidyltransferase (CCA-adding enzyme)